MLSKRKANKGLIGLNKKLDSIGIRGLPLLFLKENKIDKTTELRRTRHNTEKGCFRYILFFIT